MPPWTQSLRLGWKPELRFFETRSQLLREFETAEQLVAFRWMESFLGARLGLSDLLEVWAHGAQIVVARADGDSGDACHALETAMEFIRPSDVYFDGALFRYLIPIGEDYDSARHRTSTRVIEAVMPGENVTDWSLLLDGHSQAAALGWQAEFGIVDDREALDRIAGSIGRGASLDTVDSVPLPPDFWRAAEFPPVALFLSLIWFPNRSMGTWNGYPEVVQAWNGLVTESDRVANNVFEQLQQGTLWDASNSGSRG